MKTRSIRKLTEPLVYIVLVAAFGFITTVVNHSRDTQQVSDTELVSLTMEQQLNDMNRGEKAPAKEISL